jgi:hypothetical protein
MCVLGLQSSALASDVAGKTILAKGTVESFNFDKN